eukprot:9569266-Alexandrium_andersonii.AAC.1
MRGIRQGCPLSGCLFALCLDPWIRYMVSMFNSRVFHLSAYADDLAVALANIILSLPSIMVVLVRMGPSVGLFINGDKCVIVPFRAIAVDRLAALLNTHCHSARTFKIEDGS